MPATPIRRAISRVGTPPTNFNRSTSRTWRMVASPLASGPSFGKPKERTELGQQRHPPPARSSRNGGRHHLGTVGEIIPDWWAASFRNMGDFTRNWQGFLVPEESTDLSFRALREVYEERGLPCSLYTAGAADHFTISTRRWLAARSQRISLRRSAGRWRILASSTSRPIRRRRAAAQSGRSRRCRTACPRSWRSPA